LVLIDSHCHVFMPEFDPDRAEVLLRARRAGICRMMVIGYDLPSSRQAAVLAA
jgi:TatD DNase family protein